MPISSFIQAAGFGALRDRRSLGESGSIVVKSAMLNKFAFRLGFRHSECMIFMNYRLILACSVALGLLMLGVWAYRVMRSQKRTLLRQSVRLIAGGITSPGVLSVSFVGCGELVTTNSDAIYSPDHRYAVRTSYVDAGATGGSTSATIFSHHGFRSENIFSDGSEGVEAKNFRWLSNSEVPIEYSLYPDEERLNCASSKEIKITCQPVFTQYSQAAKP